MTPRSERRTLAGGAGAIEVALDWPTAAAPLGIACIGHPHPLYGGTLDNKVAATLARAFAGLGWLAVRPNFRGVGASAGTYDHGRGETEDFLLVAQAARGWVERGAALPLALAGFSFGSFVAAQAAALTAQGMAPAQLVLVSIAAGKWPMPAVPADALLVHGEFDETIPLADVLALELRDYLDARSTTGDWIVFGQELARAAREHLAAEVRASANEWTDWGAPGLATVLDVVAARIARGDA